MCKCTPAIKTPFCGKVGCEMPPQITKHTDVSYVPVDMFIRIARREGEPNERAMIIARRKDDGREYAFVYQDLNDDDVDLTVCDFTTNKHEPTL